MIDYIDCRIPLKVAAACITGLAALARYTDDADEERMAKTSAAELQKMVDQVNAANRAEQDEIDKDAAYAAVPKKETRPPATGSWF